MNTTVARHGGWGRGGVGAGTGLGKGGGTGLGKGGHWARERGGTG
jgi:hypothetical protein